MTLPFDVLDDDDVVAAAVLVEPVGGLDVGDVGEESLDGVHHVVRVLLVLLQLQRYRLPARGVVTLVWYIAN